jgi:hypothetical protein
VDEFPTKVIANISMSWTGKMWHGCKVGSSNRGLTLLPDGIRRKEVGGMEGALVSHGIKGII